ncbi:MAG TPA: hypothetical protein VF771_02620 [Longimicrobiaceae bacterium]
MKKLPIFTLPLAAGFLTLVWLWPGGPEGIRAALGPDDGDPDVSPCIENATIQVSANPNRVNLGESTVVSWSVGLPSGCANVRVTLNGSAVARSGSRTFTPPRNTAFSIVVSQTRQGVYQETRRSASVEVVYPPRVVIDPRTQSPVAVLLGALASGNARQTVELCDVELDMTGITNVLIGDRRELIGSPGCARGPRSLGPRIFVRDERGRAPLFVIGGDSVRISGFRLEGPTDFIAQGDRKEKGIVVSPFPSAAPLHSVEISNMEIFHWSGVGIQVVDNVEQAQRGRLFNTNPAAVRISGSFFHHNRHGSGEGYGVESAAGAYATFEQNVFDENRHAIAGGSKNDNGLDFSGYTARDNLIFPGGGKHCSDHWAWALTGWRFNCWQTHQIDMHGDQNEWYSSHNWLCGTAGETIIIERNTILYTSGHAIKIRGNPADKAVVDGNVFKNDSRSDAIAQTGECGFGDNITNPIDVRPNNVFGVDPTTELGSCDFFGDGQQDQFMATGVTWWARSPVTGEWRYLNTMRERLPQLLLARIDNDAICDVAIRPPRPGMIPRLYSKSGTGPWTPVLVVTQGSPTPAERRSPRTPTRG